MKIITNFLLILLLAEFQVYNCGKVYEDRKGYYDLGDRIYGDQLIAEATLIEAPSSKRVVYAKLILDAKKKGVLNTITAIKMRPQAISSFDAQPAKLEVVRGGTGKKEVELLLESKKGYGINYKVEIYGMW